MSDNFQQFIESELEHIRSAGLFKTERIISTPQQSQITCNSKTAINLCANNYLGLSNHPKLIEAAKASLDEYGYGMSSVRFICGTQTPHKQLEKKLSGFLKTEDTILYSSCFDANTGLFETLLGPEDAIISDSLNHASIIDGIRLCKAKRLRYKNNDMEDLEAKLKESESARFRLIASDGVFSMDGTLVNLPGLCELKNKYNALLMIDDSHAVGFIGENGCGVHEHYGLEGQVDIITGTLGKALGGASGGYTSGRKYIIDYLRQRSRPYLFSNSLAPVIANTSITAIDLIENSKELLLTLKENTKHFRSGLEKLGFELIHGEHPIIPIMLKDEQLAVNIADDLLLEGVYVIGFSFPVVPKGLARIRTQVSAAHSREDLDFALKAFEKVGKKHKAI
ncbi:glycine C-acetyltransferase [bacterium J17]|nr:glycine C-acetyltransferase [bacterium J17]